MENFGPTAGPNEPVSGFNLETFFQQTALESSIILLFDQQTELLRSLSRSRNSHVNRRKIKK